MRISLLLVLTSIYNLNVYAQTYSLKTDAEAYRYCATHKNSFVVIIWPLAQGKDEKIEKILATYGVIRYQKKTLLNYHDAYYLLAKAHPHIPDIREHVAWYFPHNSFEKHARIFVVKFPNTETTVTCKYAIRALFGLQYRSIHINDTHVETMELADFFFR